MVQLNTLLPMLCQLLQQIFQVGILQVKTNEKLK